MPTLPFTLETSPYDEETDEYLDSRTWHFDVTFDTQDNMMALMAKLEDQDRVSILQDAYDIDMLDHGGSEEEAYSLSSDVAFADAPKFMEDLRKLIELKYPCGPVVEDPE